MGELSNKSFTHLTKYSFRPHFISPNLLKVLLVKFNLSKKNGINFCFSFGNLLDNNFKLNFFENSNLILNYLANRNQSEFKNFLLWPNKNYKFHFLALNFHQCTNLNSITAVKNTNKLHKKRKHSTKKAPKPTSKHYNKFNITAKNTKLMKQLRHYLHSKTKTKSLTL